MGKHHISHTPSYLLGENQSTTKPGIWAKNSPVFVLYVPNHSLSKSPLLLVFPFERMHPDKIVTSVCLCYTYIYITILEVAVPLIHGFYLGYITIVLVGVISCYIPSGGYDIPKNNQKTALLGRWALGLHPEIDPATYIPWHMKISFNKYPISQMVKPGCSWNFRS